MENKDLVTTEGNSRELSTELSIGDVKNQVVKIQQLMHEVLQEGQHYGTIPGTEKPTLLKPGAEKINFMFRIGTGRLEITKLDFDNGHREITVTTPIIHIPTNTVLAYGIGSCSTLESKYKYRNAAKKCPTCGKETIIKGKEEYGGGWICFAKKGGCGAKYKENDKIITDQVVGKVENPDIADVYNTVLKMAAKRSYVDGTIKASAASDFFTQDIEDFVEDEPAVTQKPAQAKPIKPNPAETIAEAFSGTVEDAGLPISDMVSGVPSAPEPTPREKLIAALQYYTNAMLIPARDKWPEFVAGAIGWFTKNKEGAEKYQERFDKTVNALKTIEKDIPEHIRYAHGLYEQEDIF